MSLLPDYHVNLIAPREMSDDEINEFHSNLREVMLYIKYSKDKKTLNKVVKEDIKLRLRGGYDLETGEGEAEGSGGLRTVVT